MSQKIFTHSEANEIFKFRCKVKWQNLYTNEPTANTRYCDSCERNVHLCLTEQDVLEHAKLGNCIAIATEIPESERLKYASLDKLNESLYGIESGTPRIKPSGSVYFERDDGLKLFAFYIKNYFERGGISWSTTSDHHMRSAPELYYIYNVWQSTNDVVKKLLLDEESLASCINQNTIYMLKELLTWVDEAIAYGSTWRLYCDNLRPFNKVEADHFALTQQHTAPVELLPYEATTLSYQLHDDMDANAIQIGFYKIGDSGKDYDLCHDTNSPLDVFLKICDSHRLEVCIKANRISTQQSVIRLPIPYIDPTIRGRFMTYPTIAFTVHIVSSGSVG